MAKRLILKESVVVSANSYEEPPSRGVTRQSLPVPQLGPGPMTSISIQV